MQESQPSHVSPISAPPNDYVPVAWVVCLGVIFSLTAFFAIRWWERQNIDKTFRMAAEDRATAVNGAFETELAMLELVRSSMMSDGKIERDEFRDTVGPFLARSRSIEAVEWVPRIADSQRSECESAARRDGIDGFRITEMDKNGQLSPAARRDEYFPIYYIGPQVGNKSIYGYDVASEPTRLSALKEACDTGKIVASGQIAFVQDAKSIRGFLVCLPVYVKDKPVDSMTDRRENLMGFILGVFRPSEMIEAALEKLQPEGIDVGIFDAADQAGGRYHFHASRLSNSGQSPDPNRLFDPNGVCYLAPLHVAGHSWTVACLPTPDYFAGQRTWWPFGVLVAGLAFTAMLAGYLTLSINYTGHLEERVREQTADIRGAHEEILSRLVSATQLCDEETGMHICRVGLLSQVLARAAGWFGEDLYGMRLAASMHDVGKIGIPEAILRKPGKLTPAETAVMKTHPLVGAKIFGGSKVPLLQMARDIAMNHHERWDGKGYPRGLAGNTIPESARIVAIVDAYDALTHDRVYRPAMSENEALAMMRQGAEKQFDPTLLAAFFRHLPEIRSIEQQHPDDRSRSTGNGLRAEPIAKRAIPACKLPVIFDAMRRRGWLEEKDGTNES